MKENKDKGVVVLGIAIILVLIGALFGMSLPSEVNVYNTGEENLNLLNVSSSVTKNVSADKVELMFSVETLNDSATISQQENAALADKVMLALKSAGLNNSQIQTMNYSLREEYEWNEGLRKSVIIGYKTSNTIKVTLTDLEKTGSIIDTAVNAGVNNVSSISFTLSEQKQKEVKESALAEAATYARIKANKMATGLGIVIGDVYSVSESSSYYTPNYKSYDSVVMETSGSSTPISAGEVEVVAMVTVQFEI